MRARLACCLLLLAACGGTPPPKAAPLPHPSQSAASQPAPDPEPWRMQRPTAGPSPELAFPLAEQATLKSGLTVLTLHKPVPVASLTLVLRHGAAACPPGKSGLAALTARMLTEGTRRHPGVALAEEVEQLGTRLEADAGRDTSTLSLAVLNADLERGIEILAEVAQEPAFSKADFERVQKEWLDGLRAERQAPERLASLAGLRALLGEPHGSPVSGAAGDVEKLRVRDIVDFHQRAYTAGDAALIVVGDVSLPQVRELAEAAFKKLPARSTTLEQAFSPKPPPTKRILLVDRPGAVQSALFLAQLQPKRSEPGYERRELLTTLLGGLFTSRLNLNLREEHAYTYGAHARSIAGAHWGALYVATSVRSDVTAAALKEAVKELELVREPQLGKPIREDELGRARADLVQSLGARLEHGERIASSLAELWLYRLPQDYYQRYPALLAAETTESLSAAARGIHPDALVTVVVGDKAVIESPLKQLGYEVVPAPAELIE